MPPDAYRAVLAHADSLASGRHIAPFEEVPADALARDDDGVIHPHDQALIDEGKLLPIEPPQPQKLAGETLDARVKELDIEGASGMSADDKRAAVAKAEADLAAEAEKETNQ